MGLKELRKSKGLSARAVGRIMDMSHVQVCNIESSTDLRISTLCRYAKAIGEPVTTVMGILEKKVREIYQNA